VKSLEAQPVDLDTLVLAEQVRALYRALLPTSLSTPLPAGLAIALVWSLVDHLLALTWFVLVVGAGGIATFALWWMFAKHSALPERVRWWLRWLAIRYALSGSAWGAAGVMLFVPDSSLSQMFLVMLVACIGASSIPIASMHRWAFVSLLVPLHLPLIVRAASAGDKTGWLVAVACTAMLVYFLATSRHLHRIFSESIRNRFANAALVEQLRTQNEAVRKARDEAERARANADEANRAKSRFLAAASHDLRQPMHSLGLFIAAAKQESNQRERERLFGRIESSANAMEGLFNTLLDVSRLDAGILVPERESFALGPLLERLGAEYAASAQAKGLALRVRPCYDKVHTDAALLERVIRNFLSNAIRYTQHGGVLLACRRRKAAIRIEVWDTGEGIPNEKLSDVFQEFYQLGNPERDRSKGLGLGLAIAKRIGALLGHSIALASKVGRGSIFSIEVPVWRGDHVGPSAVRVTLPDTEALVGTVVVVIDDEGDVRDAVSVLLKQWGCNVLTAGSGAEALEVLDQHAQTPDVILSDYRLREGETGVEAIRAIQRCHGPTPAVLITGDTAPGRLKEAAASGCELLHKPVNAERLQHALLEQVFRLRKVVALLRENSQVN
jgi:two-component system, sensor histidine kinase